MLNLIIDQPGHLIQIAGIPPTRTPATIDITRCNINVVLSYLKSNGIKSFKLVNEETIPKKKSEKRTKPEEQIKKSNDVRREERRIYKDESEERLNNIEKMLKELLSKPTTDKVINKEPIIKKKKEYKEKEPEFIPQFNTAGMKMKGTTTTSKESTTDLTENIEKLKQLKGDRK